jgi:valyl-tRNA synthetase
VWYCDACGPEPIVRREAPRCCPSCGGPVRQDEDVLDTWFSSWLWPLSTLGWPNEHAPDLRAFYPTDVLVTAPEILFFWVARMIMAGYFFEGKAPFHTVYLTGVVRDMQHRKMSKSLGNGIDPLDVVHLFGADALRFTMISGLGLGTDVMLEPANLEQSFSSGRNFMTKLWNMGRFLLGNMGDARVAPLSEIDPSRLTRADEWILERLDAAIAECDAALGPARPADTVWDESERHVGLRLMEYTEAARRFVWDELAAWYLESTKPRLAEDNANGDDRDVARTVLAHVFDAALRLLHPVVPFITEALWQQLPTRDDGAFLCVANWPRERGARTDGARAFELVRETVSAIRQIKAEYGIPIGRSVDALLVGGGAAARAALAEEASLAGTLARATVTMAAEAPAGAAAHALLSDGVELVVPFAGAIDLEKECARLSGELAQLEKQLGALGTRLENPNFTTRAKPEVVERERDKLREWSTRRDQLRSKVTALCGA